MRCKDCRYQLRDLQDHRCPECGAAFDPNDPDTFDVGKPPRRRWIWYSVIGGVLLVWVFISSLDYVFSHPPRNGEPSLESALLLTLVQWMGIMFLVIVIGSAVREIQRRGPDRDRD